MITAGYRPFASGLPAGLLSVPTRLNPFAGIRTVSSPARVMFCRRVVTDDTSSRMTASPCVTTPNRSRRPFSSIHTSLSSGLPGFMNVTANRRACSARCCVSMVSAPSRLTAIWISACGAMYAVKRADSSVSAESRSASASNEAKNMFGRSSAACRDGVGLLDRLPELRHVTGGSWTRSRWC